jgi:hypothetical protein
VAIVNFDGGAGKKIDQRERSDARNANDCSQSHEQMPTIKPDHRFPFNGSRL